jgi:hypothetical protein
MLKAPPWTTSHIKGPHAVLPHLGIHATWYHIPHLCELVCILTLACDSNPFDCKASLPQTLSMGTTATVPFPTLGLKKQSSPLGNLALAPKMNTSHSYLTLWALLATTGPMNPVNYPRPYQPLWSYLITLHVGHPLHPISLCTPSAQQRADPAPPALGASPISCIKSQPHCKCIPDSSLQLSSTLQGSATTYSSALVQGCFAGLFTMVELLL